MPMMNQTGRQVASGHRHLPASGRQVMIGKERRDDCELMIRFDAKKKYKFSIVKKMLGLSKLLKYPFGGARELIIDQIFQGCGQEGKKCVSMLRMLRNISICYLSDLVYNMANFLFLNFVTFQRGVKKKVFLNREI